jgi:hypothetical protein
VELTRTHFVVLFVAADGLDVASVLSGIDTVSADGECFPLTAPIPLEDARSATLELFDAGALEVHRLALGDGEYFRLDDEVARSALADLSTWRSSAASLHDLALTPVGEQLYETTYDRFGGDMERSTREAQERDKEFARRHPDYMQRRKEYLDQLNRWLRRGGPEPEPPRFD